MDSNASYAAEVERNVRETMIFFAEASSNKCASPRPASRSRHSPWLHPAAIPMIES